MSTTSLITAAQLSKMPCDGKRYELVSGELRVMPPSGWKHGEVVARIHTRLGHYVQQQELGKLFGAETGFFIFKNPDTVRAPDVAFIASENLPAADPEETYWPGPPDLAVEVLSPNDRTGEVDEKLHTWLAAGCRMVWAVDPKLQTVTIYRSKTDVQVRTVNEMLEGDEVVFGFSCPVAEIFATR